jgi:hypothetical protein
VSGETDLARMLASLDVERRPGRFAVVTVPAGEHTALSEVAHAAIDESEGRTLVVPVDRARAVGAGVDFEAAWLTVTVHSSLEAVGLTAAMSAALAAAGIACNVLAGYHHDHLLVPHERADEAIRVLRSLRDR